MSMKALRPVPRISIQAFCETESVAIPIERAGEDRRMAKAHLKVHMGGISTAIEFYQTAPTPNLIILESRREPRDLIEALKQLAEFCDSNSKVVVIGHYNDVWLYRELIRSGISEYIVAPISMADIVGVISSIFVDPQAEPIGRSIAFIGAKGGVGSSTLAHNVAWSMSSLFGSEVVVADLDLAFGTANINFDQDPAQGIAEAVFAPERIDEVYLDRLLATCAEHLSLLAAPSTLDRVYDFDPDAFAHLIDTAQRSAPVIVLDIPHAWNGWTKNTLMKADEIVITATPELANLAQHEKSRRHAEKAEAERLAAEAGDQPGRCSETPRDHRRRFCRAARNPAHGCPSVRSAAIRQCFEQWTHAGRNGRQACDLPDGQRDGAHPDRTKRDQGQEENRSRKSDRQAETEQEMTVRGDNPACLENEATTVQAAERRSCVRRHPRRNRQEAWPWRPRRARRVAPGFVPGSAAAVAGAGRGAASGARTAQCPARAQRYLL